jgi:hypothetical protein
MAKNYWKSPQNGIVCTRVLDHPLNDFLIQIWINIAKANPEPELDPDF